MSGCNAPAIAARFAVPRASLLRNVVAGYALQAANYALPLVTLPYLIRTLGARAYGSVAIAYAVVYFLVLFVDAGFNTRAARQLARADISQSRVNVIFAATQCIKLVLALAALALLVVLVPAMTVQAPLYFASYLLVVGSLVFPTWLFQGLEVMHHTTVCSVGGRLLATLGIFVFVNGPDDALIAALLQSSATALAGLLAWPVVTRGLGLSVCVAVGPLLAEIRRALRETRGLAVSEFVSNAMSNSGVFVLSLFAADAVVGVYAALEKITRAVFNLFQPLLRALFPRIASGGVAPGYWKRWSLRIGALALLVSGALCVLAPTALEVLFGADWAMHGTLLRWLSAWLLLGVIAAALGQLGLLGRGHRTPYAACLLGCAVLQIVAAVAGAAWYGIHGIVIALVVTEGTRLFLFITVLRIKARQ